MEKNVAAALSYLLGFITGIYFFLTSKDSFVKFHAMQSTILSLGVLVLNIFLNWVPLFGRTLSSLVGLVSFVLWIVLMIKAYQQEKYKLPVIGDLAEKQVK